MNMISALTQQRNPTLNIAGLTVKVMGDPHLGRRFITGVPLHRAGEREREILAAFKDSLSGKYDVHVCMGDLFDKAVVTLDVIREAAAIYRQAAMVHNRSHLIVIKGNHDAGGDEEKTTAFDVFVDLVAGHENIGIAAWDQVLWVAKPDCYSLAFVPWSRQKSSVEMVETIDKADAVFGHWDIHSFGNDRNLVPTEALAGCTPLVITGHDHTPTRFERHGVEVIGTGSLQPFTHGEDPMGEVYRTLGLADALALPAAERERLCLRVVVDHDEVVPFDELDCRQLDIVRRDTVVDAGPIDFGALDIRSIWDNAMTEHGVPADFSSRLFTMFANREVPK